MLSYISSFFTPKQITDEEILKMRKNILIGELSIKCTKVYTYINPKECFKCSFLCFQICDCETKNLLLIDYKFITNCEKFFKYCHYPLLHQSQNDLHKILSNKRLLRQCIKNQHTFCPITATLLSKSTFKEKQRIIKILLSYEFMISDDCISMIKLILYKKLPRNNILLFLSLELLLEIKDNIIKKLIEIYKIKYIPIASF